MDLFQKVSSSVFVVQSLDENGKILMLGRAVALARDFLITNCHVVQNGSSFKVTRGKESWNARLIQAAPSHDLCGLRPSGLTLQAVGIRPSSKLATGEHVYAIGSPEGLELTFSEGVISALRDTEGVRMVQTSAAISPGSSGGGLFDAQGNLVGITTFYLKEGQSLNFALPGEWVTAMLARSTESADKSSNRPSDPQLECRAWLDIGLEAVKKEDYELATHSLRRAADFNQSDSPKAWLELGRLADKASSLSSASDAYKAWFFEKFKSWPQKEVQDALQRRAIASFERAIELKPDYADAWLALGVAYIDKKQYDQAISSTKEATRLAPDNWRGWMVLAMCYTETESHAEATDALQRLERTAPPDSRPGLLYFAGMQYAKMKDRQQVMRVYQQLKASDPKTADRFFREYVLPQPGGPASK